jgi:hypothetical protein
MNNSKNFGFILPLSVFMLVVWGLLFAQPLDSAELDVTGQQTMTNGFVARYQIPAASETAETPSLDVSGYSYATVQIVGVTDSLTGSAEATFTVKGSAFPVAGYEAIVPSTIGGATASGTIQHFGAWNFELGGLNRFMVAASGNSATKELVISLRK